jgi:hypothetical protein
MSYIGNSYLSQQFTPAVDYFNGNASTTAFTLSKTIGSVYDIQVVVENVPQNPASAFTVSGNVITFTSAPPSGTNNIYVRYTSPMTNVVKPAPGTVSPTEINSNYSLWNLSSNNISYTANSSSQIFSVTNSGTTSGVIAGFGSVNVPNLLTLAYDVASGTATFQGSPYGATALSSNGANLIMLNTNSTERMRITSSGNIGVGTTSPNYPLHLFNSTANKEVVYIQGTNTNTGTGLAGEGPIALQNTNTTNNNMAAISNFDGNGNINNQINFINTDHAGGGAIAFTTRANGGASYGERMRIAQDGSIRIGAQNFANAIGSSNFGMSLNNTNAGAYSYAYSTTTNTHWGFGNGNGGTGSIQTNGSSTSFNTSSDYRLKENVQPMVNALLTVAQLKPVTYKWKVDGSDGQGFIAHELQEVIPDAVSGEKDAVDEEGNIKPQGIDTSFLVATLTAAIQEQQAIIENLKSRIEVLEAK